MVRFSFYKPGLFRLLLIILKSLKSVRHWLHSGKDDDLTRSSHVFSKMFVPLRFWCCKLTSVSNKLQWPISVVQVSFTLYKRSIWNSQCRRPILENKFSRLDVYKRYKRTKKEVMLLNSLFNVIIFLICVHTILEG